MMMDERLRKWQQQVLTEDDMRNCLEYLRTKMKDDMEVERLARHISSQDEIIIELQGHIKRLEDFPVYDPEAVKLEEQMSIEDILSNFTEGQKDGEKEAGGAAQVGGTGTP